MRLFLFYDMYIQCYKFLSQPSFSCVPHFDTLYIHLHWVLCIFKFYFNTSFLIYGLFRSMNLLTQPHFKWMKLKSSCSLGPAYNYCHGVRTKAQLPAGPHWNCQVDVYNSSLMFSQSRVSIAKKFTVVSTFFPSPLNKGNRLFLELFLSVPIGGPGLEVSVSSEIYLKRYENPKNFTTVSFHQSQTP